MKPRFLIDTDWSIDYLQGKPETTARVADLLRRKVLALSIVCLAELYEGVIYSRDPARRERALNQFVRGVRLLTVDKETARIFGQEETGRTSTHRRAER